MSCMSPQKHPCSSMDGFNPLVSHDSQKWLQLHACKGFLSSPMLYNCMSSLPSPSHAFPSHYQLHTQTSQMALHRSSYTLISTSPTCPIHLDTTCHHTFLCQTFFIYILLISLTLIHSNIDNIGLFLAFTIIELKFSLNLFTRKSVKALGQKWGLVHCAGSTPARCFKAFSSKLLRCSIPLSNSLTDVVLAHLHCTLFNSMPLWLILKLFYICFR